MILLVHARRGATTTAAAVVVVAMVGMTHHHLTQAPAAGAVAEADGEGRITAEAQVAGEVVRVEGVIGRAIS